MITTAAQGQMEAVGLLWQQTFGDDSEYVSLFLNRRARLANTLVYQHGGVVCGMLFILPCHLTFGQERYKCAYLYGVATAKEYRGQGISSRLLRYARDLSADRGYDVCALAPSDKSLFDFYAKRGYSTQGYIRTLSVSYSQIAETSSPVVLSDISSEEIGIIRKKWFADGYLEWDSEAIDYAIEENEQMKGKFYRYRAGGEVGSICCRPQGDSLVIKEYAGGTSQLYGVAGALHKIYQKEQYRFRLSNRSGVGEPTPSAMTQWIAGGTDKPFFPSLALD